MGVAFLGCLVPLLMGTLPVPSPTATGRTHQPDAVARFQAWFKAYGQRRIALLQPGLPGGPGGSFRTTTERQRLEEVFAGLESLDGIRAARLLAAAATFSFSPPQVEMKRDVAEQPWIVRRRALEALGRLRRPEARAWIRTQMLEDRSGADAAGRRAVAARAIGRQNDPAGAYHLSRALRDEAPQVRVAAATALGRLGTLAGAPALLEAVDDPQETVRVASLGALVEVLASNRTALGPSRLESILGPVRLRLDDSSWRARLAAVELVSRIRSTTTIPALIDALAHEQPGARPDARGRVRAAIQEGLRALTGAFHPEDHPEEWRRWWEEVSPTFQLPAEPASSGAQSRYGTFFQIPVDSTSVLFVIDVSGSMQEAMGEGGTGREARSKWQYAYEELEHTLLKLHEDTRFGLILFSDRVDLAAARLRRATAETRHAALGVLRRHAPQGGTNLFDALAAGLGLNTLGLAPAAASTQADTIFVLSDGSPTVGTLVDPDEIIAAITRANHILRVRINTISFGPEDSYLLEDLARRNNGAHIHIRR